MIDTEKPPLSEAYLAHFGVKGMKWGRRKANSSSSPREDTVIRINHQQKVAAATALGIAATGALLYKTGTAKAALVGTSTLGLEGAKLSARILVDGGSFLARSTIDVGRFAGKAAYNVGSGAVKTVNVMLGRSNVKLTTGERVRQRVNALLAKKAQIKFMRNR